MKRFLIIGIILVMFSGTAQATGKVANRICPEVTKLTGLMWDRYHNDGATVTQLQNAFDSSYDNKTEAGRNFSRFMTAAIDIVPVMSNRDTYNTFLYESCVDIATSGQFGNGVF